MYTFGAPRAGNRAFADEFERRLGGRSWRITNASDIVPTVPRLMVRALLCCRGRAATGREGKEKGGAEEGIGSRQLPS